MQQTEGRRCCGTGAGGVAKDTFADTYAGQRQPKYVARYFNMTQKKQRAEGVVRQRAGKEKERERKSGRGRGKSKP